MYIPRKPPAFNPFIVLSDVTISTIVILAVLLMLFTGVLSAAVGQRDSTIAEYKAKDEKLNRIVAEIKLTQGLIHSSVDKDLDRVLVSEGRFRMLLRFPDSSHDFAITSHGKVRLTATGRKLFGRFATVIKPYLLKYREELPGNGWLNEVQIQGHTSRVDDSDFAISLEKAQLVRNVLANEDGFPEHLLSVAAYGSSRPAYESSESVGKRQFSKDKSGADGRSIRLYGAPVDFSLTKQQYDSRIDIIIIFAGQKSENDFVKSVDWSTGKRYGQPNDVSVETIDSIRAQEGYDTMRGGR